MSSLSGVDTRKLRVQIGSRPVRVFYAFDPLRNALLPIVGDKTGDDCFYEVFVPVADWLFALHDLLKPENLAALTELTEATASFLGQGVAIDTFAGSAIGATYAMCRKRKP